MTLQAIKIDLINHCNATCPFCPYHGSAGSVTRQLRERSEPVSMLELGELESIAAELEERRLRPLIKFSGRGEATIHPEFLPIVDMFVSKGLPTRLITNGLRLEQQAEVLARLQTEVIVSVHGKAEVHDAVIGRAGAYSAALRGIQRTRSQGGRISAALIVSKANIADLEAVVDILAREYGIETRVHHNFDLAERSLIDPTQLQAIMTRLKVTYPEIRFVPFLKEDALARYYGSDHFVLNAHQCVRHLEEIEISSDGSLFVCDSAIFGNIRKGGLGSVFGGSGRTHFLEKIRGELVSTQGLAPERCDRCCYQKISV